MPDLESRWHVFYVGMRVSTLIPAAGSSRHSLRSLVCSRAIDEHIRRPMILNDSMRVAGMKMECESDLAEAMPILNEALAALDTIKDADIQYIKKLGNPPALIKLVMEVSL